MKTSEKNMAIELRKQGRTFGEILEKVSASKGSLSYWLRDIELTNEQRARIRYKNDKIKEKFIRFNEQRRSLAADRHGRIASDACAEIDHLSEKELKLMGIALYWAEGYKGRCWKTVSFTNTDPAMIRLMMRWFRNICRVPEQKFRIRIQCHSVEKIKGSQRYWSAITHLPLSQFSRTYTRLSPTSKKQAGLLCPYGICEIRISDVALLSTIKGWIQGLAALSSSLA